MISAESAISRFRRDLTLGALVRYALAAAAVLAILADPFSGGTIDAPIVLIVVGGLWLFLSFRSMQGSRIAADSPSLIASGQYDAAEQRIVAALRSFSLFKTVKVLSLHHLAMLRHAQHRWNESAMLACAVLGGQRRQRGTAIMRAAVNPLNKSARLILAAALLEMDDLGGAYDSIVQLYDQRLSLAEALNLLGLQLDYMARIGAWDAMLAGADAKIEMAELMPTSSGADCASDIGAGGEEAWA